MRTWTDKKGRTVEVIGMSNRWLMNAYKYWKDKDSSKVSDIKAEIQRRQKKRENFNKQNRLQ